MKYPFHALDNIELENGYTQVETPYGPAVAYEDLEALELAITKTLVFKEDGLSGPQVRAVRRALALTQEELAKHLEVKPLTIKRWESEQTRLSKADAFFIRSLAAEKWLSFETHAPLSTYSANPFPKTLHFSWTGSSWNSKEFPILCPHVATVALGQPSMSISNISKLPLVWVVESTHPIPDNKGLPAWAALKVFMNAAPEDDEYPLPKEAMLPAGVTIQ